MGKLHHFVGVKINYLNSWNIWIGQPAYVRKLLKKFETDNSKPVEIPVEIGTQLVKAKDGDNLVDQELCQSAVGSRLYKSTKTRPDIAYGVGYVAHFSSKPTQTHWVAVKRIMGYLNETPDFQLLCVANDNITGFSEADWAGDNDDHKSTSGFVFMMSGSAISWNSKKQTCAAFSTAEAEYIALATQELIWFQRLLMDMNKNSVDPMTIFEDNQSRTPNIMVEQNISILNSITSGKWLQ